MSKPTIDIFIKGLSFLGQQ